MWAILIIQKKIGEMCDFNFEPIKQELKPQSYYGELFNIDFGTFYKLNLLMQPKVIKSTSKYLDMMQGGNSVNY